MSERELEERRLRGEEIPSVNPMGRGIPHDIRTQIKDYPVIPGTISQNVEVISTFDTRPINAIDFYFASSTSVEPTGTAQFLFTVPSGYVAVLRGFKYALQTIFTPFNRSWVTCTVNINGSAVQNYNALQLGQVVNDLVPIHAIAKEGDIIEIAVTILAAILPPGTITIDVAAEMHGNLLLSRGLPSNFEIGNIKPAKTIRYGVDK